MTIVLRCTDGTIVTYSNVHRFRIYNSIDLLELHFVSKKVSVDLSDVRKVEIIR